MFYCHFSLASLNCYKLCKINIKCNQCILKKQSVIRKHIKFFYYANKQTYENKSPMNIIVRSAYVWKRKNPFNTYIKISHSQGFIDAIKALGGIEFRGKVKIRIPGEVDDIHDNERLYEEDFDEQMDGTNNRVIMGKVPSMRAVGNLGLEVQQSLYYDPTFLEVFLIIWNISII